jgi:hypothetical protein
VDAAISLKVLGRLAQSRTPASEDAIGRACDRAFVALAKEVSYDELEFAIEVLAIVGFRRSSGSVAALLDFMRSAEQRHLVHSQDYSAMSALVSKYRGPHSLMTKAIKVLSGLRYLETPAVLKALLWASVHSDDTVRKEATSALSSLAKYNISVFYGDDSESGRGIGATPQLAVIDVLEKMEGSDLLRCLESILLVAEGLLSTSMESARWSSTAVTLSRASTPADGGVPDVRRRTIALLKRIYSLVQSTSQRLSVIRAMNAAARADSQVAKDQHYADMISANAREVLAWFAEIVPGEELQVVQKIEHDSYWIHYHSASEEVRSAALAVKVIIDLNAEYSIYKTLVGFEGIFGDWSKSRRDESYSLRSQEARSAEAKLYVAKIPGDGFDVWRRRILTFARTESNDMATFPVFYEFLAEVAGQYPKFAVELLERDSQPLSKFLIPILRGLWDSELREELRPLIAGWIVQAKHGETDYLYACAKLFLSTKDVDVRLLRQLLDKATELKDAYVMRQVASVSIARGSGDESPEDLREIFMTALSRLTELGDANWVSEIWYRKEAKEVVAALTSADRKDVLRNLSLLAQIDYQAEDVLAVIAEVEPEAVADFLLERAYQPDDAASARTEGGGYEDLPYQLHTLHQPLSKHPDMLIHKALAWYRKDASLFAFKGAKLLQTVFPEFADSFRDSLVTLVRKGDELELEFVAGVLRAYEGQTFIHPVAKELVKRLPSSGEIVDEVEIALQNTGVVSGEYGMAEAYERKRLEVMDWLQDADERVRGFASNYVKRLEVMRDAERKRSDESIALRKFEFGEK